GIRDKLVTGVQTCALPILLHHPTLRGHDLEHVAQLARAAVVQLGERHRRPEPDLGVGLARPGVDVRRLGAFVAPEEESESTVAQIGRASCRGKVVYCGVAW